MNMPAELQNQLQNYSKLISLKIFHSISHLMVFAIGKRYINDFVLVQL